MYFSTRYQRIHRRLININAFLRYTLTFLVLGIILFWWLFLFFFPTQQLITHYQTQIASLHKQDRMDLGAPDIKKEDAITQLQEKIAQIKEKHTKNSNEHIGFILDQARQVGLRVGACMPQHEKNKQWYHVSHILFNFSGSFDAVQNFFNRLKDIEAIRCSTITFTQADKDELLQLKSVLKFYQFE